MNKSVFQIINNSNSKPKEKYNILTFPTHERYETQLCKTGHNFYSFITNGQKTWNTEQCPYPENYYTLPQSNICSHINYDFILSQSKFGQIQIAQKISSILNIPIISLEHTLPLYNVQPKSQIDTMRQLIGNVNVFISEYSQHAWDISYESHVIHHGIDTETFKPLGLNRDNHILTVANDFQNRDYCLNYTGWKRVTSEFQTQLIGNNGELSKSATSVEELTEGYNKCAVYFNSTTLSPIPTSLLEAMSCGCAVVSTATCMIPAIIQHGENGFISNNEEELKSYIRLLLNDSDLRSRVGNNARETIKKLFSEDKFIANWNKLFTTTYEVFYK